MANASTLLLPDQQEQVGWYQNWPTTVALLVVPLLAIFVKATWQPSFPKGAPKLVSESRWPIVGAWQLYRNRKDFFLAAVNMSATGNFSTYFGKHPIVGVSGHEARKSFFEAKELDMNEGYGVLLAAGPKVDAVQGENAFNNWFARTITRLMKRENFVRNLDLLTGDTVAALDRIIDRNGGAKTGVFDPFDDIYRIVYQLTMRTVGATEIAESPELLEKTLKMFEDMEGAASATRIAFPWLPTRAYLTQMMVGAQLYSTFNNIAKERKATGQRYEDAMQFLLDSDVDMIRVLSFILGALFAGQLNSGINAAWFFVYLATNKEWYHRIQAEVDGVLARHRDPAGPRQSVLEILVTLSVEDWESEFPSIDLALRECIRLQMVGTAFRRNISGRDVVISNTTGEVIPKDAFAMYLIDDVHMNPDIYPNPERFDPGRFERGEDKKAYFGYVGWGVGRHPCLGMRFAKLEMMIIGAIFVAMFDFEVLDAQGNTLKDAPLPDRQKFTAHKPAYQLNLKYTVREQ